jgi:hypothetical protein
MTLFDDILSQFPAHVQVTVRKIWEELGPEEKASFQSLLVGFPSDANLVKIIVKSSTAQIRQAFGNKHRVVIVGPTNVGKSTLYNQLVQNKRDQAVVSPLPGTTTENQQADAALFTVVDTPGADAQWGVWASNRKTWPFRRQQMPIFSCWSSTPFRVLKRPSRIYLSSFLL